MVAGLYCSYTKTKEVCMMKRFVAGVVFAGAVADCRDLARAVSDAFWNGGIDGAGDSAPSPDMQVR